MDDDLSPGKINVDAGKTGQSSTERRITDFVRIGVVGLFAYWSLTLVAPFAVIIIWASILVVALYPAYASLRRLFGGRGRPAAILITLASLVIIIGPVAAIALNFAEAAQAFFARLTSGTFVVPTPPQSVREWPLIGERAYAAWSLASTNLAATLKQFEASLLQVGSAALGQIASIGGGLVSFVVSVILAGFLFRPAPRLAEGVRSFARRIAGDRGVGFVNLAGATIRNVARGVIGVALLQAFLCGLIFVLFGVPAPGVITFAILILCIVQIGPALILLPLIVWAWATWTSLPALVFMLLLIPIMIIDNVMKPLLVARGLSTPMLVILVGVIGGTLSHGLVGLFLGPIVLSVFYDLLVAWVWSPPQISDEDRLAESGQWR
ncbi:MULTISPECIES: AI-2E family transporter [unclassified Sinorhizobium]|uniref:AI-2E family transporter n=1 Tax=unclassified Sinorhizobium TaxID=2613772 RepID=UPI00352583CD